MDERIWEVKQGKHCRYCCLLWLMLIHLSSSFCDVGSSDLPLPLHQFYNQALQDGTIDMFGSAIPWLLAPDSHYVWSHMEPGASPLIVFQDHASDKTMKDWSQFNRNEVYIFASAVEDFLLNNLISGLSLEDRKKKWCCYVKYLASPKEWYQYYCILHGNILAHTIIENRQSSFQSVITMQCNFPKMVDGFEGHEKGVIIFSTVWNNTGGYNSFLTNKQWRVWLLCRVSIQVKQHELEWERDCCYQGWQVCWVQASCSLFDGQWGGAPSAKGFGRLVTTQPP